MASVVQQDQRRRVIGLDVDAQNVANFDVVRRGGDRLLFFQDGGELLGEDFEECTVDGVHPTDLGVMRIADGLTPVVRGILGL